MNPVTPPDALARPEIPTLTMTKPEAPARVKTGIFGPILVHTTMHSIMQASFRRLRIGFPPHDLRAYITLSVFCLLSACAIRPPQPSLPFDEHQSALATIDHWRIKGRIGVRHQDRGGSASLQWEQHGATYSAHLHGPLGIGSVFIDGDDQHASLRDQHGSRTAASAEDLITQVTGWSIPVSPIRYWAKGMPDPTLSITSQRVEDGRLIELQQAGWTIKYSDYQPVDGFWLPHKVIMSRPQASLTLLPKQWHLL